MTGPDSLLSDAPCTLDYPLHSNAGHAKSLLDSLPADNSLVHRIHATDEAHRRLHGDELVISAISVTSMTRNCLCNRLIRITSRDGAPAPCNERTHAARRVHPDSWINCARYRTSLRDALQAEFDRNRQCSSINGKNRHHHWQTMLAATPDTFEEAHPALP